MVSVFDRILWWGVFFSSIPFQSHSGNFRSSLPCPAGKRWRSISKNHFLWSPSEFWIVIFTYTYLCFSRIHFFNSWELRPFQRVLGPCIFILSHCRCSPGFSSFGSTKPPCKENQMCLSVWKSGKGMFHSKSNRVFTLTSVDKWIIF